MVVIRTSPQTLKGANRCRFDETQYVGLNLTGEDADSSPSVKLALVDAKRSVSVFANPYLRPLMLGVAVLAPLHTRRTTRRVPLQRSSSHPRTTYRHSSELVSQVFVDIGLSVDGHVASDPVLDCGAMRRADGQQWRHGR